MYRAVLALIALMTSVGAPGAAAQGARSPARALAARAESLEALVARQDSAAKRARYDDLRARRFDAGDVTVLVPAIVGEVTGGRIASGAEAYLDTMGGVPRAFVRSVVPIASATAGWDSVLRAGGLAGRRRLTVDVAARPDTFADGWTIAVAIARAYTQTLDEEWRAWLPVDLGIGWKHGREDAAAVRDLAAGETRVGIECLGGRAAACRLWLGLDREPDAYGARYTPAEIRHIVAMRPFAEYLGPTAARCTQGSDEECLRYARAGQVPAVPASASALRSVLRELRVLHGADALRRALADTSGAIGQRLARGAGIGEDSLVAEWRGWLLTGGGRSPVSAGTCEAMPVLLFGGLLLLAAARSGRWR
jgi:hypothetical protein